MVNSYAEHVLKVRRVKVVNADSDAVLATCYDNSSIVSVIGGDGCGHTAQIKRPNNRIRKGQCAGH